MDSSAVASSSSRSSGENSTSRLRSEVTAAQPAASGVRRSWPTARSSAVRIRSAAFTGSTSAAASASRARSTAEPTCAANAARTRRSDDDSVRPRSTRQAPGPAGTKVVPSASGGSSASSADSMPKVSRVRSSSAGIVASPRTMVPARDDMVSASAVARAERLDSLSERSTTPATVAATTAKTASASSALGSFSVNAPTGGMNQ